MSSQRNNSSISAALTDRQNYLLELLPIAAMIILANSVVFVLFGSRKTLRTSSNYFLLSLAICDFFNGTVNIVLYVTAWTLASRGIRMSDATFIAIPTLHNFTVIVTSFHIFVITSEKYFAIVMPFRRRTMLTKTVANTIIFFIWTLSGMLTALLMSMEHGSEAEKVFNIAIAVWLFFLLLLMSTAYIVMFRTLHKRRLHMAKSNQRRKTTNIVNERKCLLVFVSLLVVFGVCWCPWFVIGLVMRLGPLQSGLHGVLNAYTKIRYLSSVLNPLVYTLFKNDFQQALRSFFCTSRRQRTETRPTDTYSDQFRRFTGFFSTKSYSVTKLDEETAPTNDIQMADAYVLPAHRESLPANGVHMIFGMRGIVE